MLIFINTVVLYTIHIKPHCACQMVLLNCCCFWYLDFFNVLEGVMMHSHGLSQDLNYYILQSTLLFMVVILDNAERLEVRVTACRPELTLQSWVEVSLCVWINRC